MLISAKDTLAESKFNQSPISDEQDSGSISDEASFRFLVRSLAQRIEAYARDKCDLKDIAFIDINNSYAGDIGIFETLKKKLLVCLLLKKGYRVIYIKSALTTNRSWEGFRIAWSDNIILPDEVDYVLYEYTMADVSLKDDALSEALNLLEVI